MNIEITKTHTHKTIGYLNTAKPVQRAGTLSRQDLQRIVAEIIG